MTQPIQIECGVADEFGRRPVIARCGDQLYRDRFNTEDAFRRRRFAEAAMAEFHQPVIVDTVTQIGAKIVEESAARDARPASSLQPVVTRLDNVAAREVEWLWPGRVALGAVTLIAGDPGLGKSFITLDMAARVSTGAAWPDEERATRSEERENPAAKELAPRSSLLAPASVILISAEDDPATTIRPRFEALGGAIEQIYIIATVQDRDDDKKYTRPFELGLDMERLAKAVEELQNCRLIVVDPVSAYLGRTNENANGEVRRILAPLADLAAKFNLAVVLVSHLRKEDGTAMYRTLGSVAFVAAARAAWTVIRDPRQRERRLLVPVKNNLSVDGGALAYTIEPVGPSGAPVVYWSAEPVEAPVGGDFLAPSRPAHRSDAERTAAADWLRELLAAAPLPATEVRLAAEERGYSFGTVRRAFRDLAGEAIKAKGERHGQWLWQLPGTQELEQDAQNPTPGLVRTLSPEEGSVFGVENPAPAS